MSSAPPQAPPRRRPAPVVAIEPHEEVEFDPDILEALCEAHGHFAEEVIAGALFRIEERLLLASWQAENGEHGGLRRTGEELRRLGREIGMRTLVRSAEAVLDRLDRGGDGAADPALQACIARLRRLGRPGTLARARGGGSDLGTIA